MRISWLAPALIVVCLYQAAYSPGPAGAATPSSDDPGSLPCMVFIVSDALRADILGCYGGPAVTPNIDRLAANGMLFEEAYSNATWTIPSSASMFTGRHPDAFPYEIIVKNDRERYLCRIPQEAVPIWSELAARGYDLSCYIENGLVAHTGALRGIETVLTRSGVGSADRKAIDGLLGEDAYRHKQKYYPILDHLLKMPEDRPFLLLIWFLDPHAPYRPPRDEEGDIRARYGNLAEDVGFYRNLTAFDIRDMGESFSDEEASLLRDLYVGEVESIDGRVGNIIRTLILTGRLDDTYLVFTSDHGEAFGEHGRFVHGGPGFYQELVHVPLIVAGPGLPGGREIGDRVSHVQLMPTMRSLLDLPPGDGSMARSVLDPAAGGRGESTPLYFAGTADTCYAVLKGDWKLMVEGSDRSLFNLSSDPGETTSVYGRFPDVTARLLEIADGMKAESDAHRLAVGGLSEPRDKQEADIQEIKKTLRALGYVQ